MYACRYPYMRILLLYILEFEIRTFPWATAEECKSIIAQSGGINIICSYPGSIY